MCRCKYMDFAVCVWMFFFRRSCTCAMLTIKYTCISNTYFYVHFELNNKSSLDSEDCFRVFCSVLRTSTQFKIVKHFNKSVIFTMSFGQFRIVNILQSVCFLNVQMSQFVWHVSVCLNLSLSLYIVLQISTS